nr:unnamed protein product [Digitaria exilis]
MPHAASEAATIADYIAMSSSSRARHFPTSDSTATTKDGMAANVQVCIAGAMSAGACFTARPSDILIATLPKQFRHDMDQVVSLCHRAPQRTSLFCDGVSAFGPYFGPLARPEHVLFFMYEEVWRDPPGYVRRLAAFTGLPFDVEEEEENGVVDAIVRLCLVNKTECSWLARWGIARSSGVAVWGIGLIYRRILHDASTLLRRPGSRGSGLNV